MTDFGPSRALLRRVRVACLLAALGGVAVNAHAQCGDWEPVGTGRSGSVFAMTVFDDGSGPALYAGQSFPNQSPGIARWDGSAWLPFAGYFTDGGMNPSIHALKGWNDGTGPALYVAGIFGSVDWIPGTGNIVRLRASTGWEPVGDGISSYRRQEEVYALASLGGWLYAGGAFEERFGNPGNNIARWNGSAWSPLGGGVGAAWDAVFALEVFNDGSGPALYVGHSSWHSDFIDRWDGSSWWPVGTGVSGSVSALKVFDDGNGPALYAGGWFTGAGGNPANRIARWDGTAWSALGEGVSGGGINALTVFDDGTGPALYAGGTFTEAGGRPASRIARWDGTAWTPLGAGVSGGQWAAVHAMSVFDDGTGPALYAAGRFEEA
ncbi:MAG: hypothetical protein EA423_01075, partial [Phycisphaerales bacterium]